ncbi:MAG: hypothetical protein CMI79_04385 [Candidatus Pelagibacter sp.]|nr:hypothetical protein [Candidatus Pelagibacter sp.]|tara:strand:+ start:5959 stop:7413 length:1455 start_codon:yes stop_codon:yes gene_type:complete
MLASIRKFSKSFLAKVFIAIIAMPFLLWGMGDVFRSGNQNVLVEINDEKINSKEFITYLQKISLTQEELNSLGKSKILDEILTNYISEKIIDIESKKKGLNLTDTSLKKIIVNDKNFKKENKFSRTSYEKFLLQNNYTAQTYEKYIRDIEVKGQLLNYYSGGIKLPNFMINNLYVKENKSLNLEFIDLNKIFSKVKIKENEIKEFYDQNKSFFNERFISFKYLELLPEYLTQKKDFDEEYYKELDEIENLILDGKEFKTLVLGNEKNVKTINLVNSRQIKKDGTSIDKMNNEIFNKIFAINNQNSVQFINSQNKYFIVKLLDDKNINLDLNDKDLKKTITAQLQIKFKIDENRKLIEKINNGKFNKTEMLEMSKKNNITIDKLKIDSINDKKKFTKNLVEKIYNYNAGDIFVISDSILKENFLVNIIEETKPSARINSDKYKAYVDKANAIYISKLYKSYDKYINANYKIDLNDKVLERLKNSF